MRVAAAFALAGWTCLAPRQASAVQYEIFIDIEAEEDLYDLRATEQISAGSFDALLLLLQTRVNLNRADRQRLYLLPNLDYAQVDSILAYRETVGSVGSVDELADRGVLSKRLATSLRAFTIVDPPGDARGKAHGFVRIQARWTGRHDRLPPASAIQARVQAPDGLDAGVALALTRNRLGRPRWDRDRGALTAAPERARVEVPKLYVGWEGNAWEVVAGTYRIGFGQRLTFDVTDQIAPNGAFGDSELRRDSALVRRCRRAAGELSASPCPTASVVRVTPDYAWTPRLAGVALGAHRIPLGAGWLQANAWGSYQTHRVAQSELVNANECSDPRRDADAACAPPPVYVRSGDDNAPFGAASQAALPAVFAEGLGGAHVGYFWNARTHLGATGYGAVPRWLVRGATLDFQESARRPIGGPFGAVGLEAAVGFGAQDLFVEVAKSFDGDAGGGFGAVLRSVTALAAAEIDVSLRYFGTAFANPYARPVSAPDELDGLRARDEAGLRVRATASLGPRVGLRAIGDVWRRHSSGVFRGLVFARTDLELAQSWRWALWAEHRSGGGQRLSVATQLGYAPTPRLDVVAQVRHRWAASVAAARPRGDIAAVVNLTARPVERLRIRLRVRYDIEGVANGGHPPQSLWALVEYAVTTRTRDHVRARYDFRVFLDDRASTRARVPNPEHALWLEYAFRY